MKILAAILAFIVLALSVQPACCGIVASAMEQRCGDEDQSHAHNKQEDGRKGACKTVCNPFQSCDCCGGSVTHVLTAFEVTAPLMQAPRVRYVALYANQVPQLRESGFWHPPRIS